MLRNCATKTTVFFKYRWNDAWPSPTKWLFKQTEETQIHVKILLNIDTWGITTKKSFLKSLRSWAYIHGASTFTYVVETYEVTESLRWDLSCLAGRQEQVIAITITMVLFRYTDGVYTSTLSPPVTTSSRHTPVRSLTVEVEWTWAEQKCRHMLLLLSFDSLPVMYHVYSFNSLVLNPQHSCSYVELANSHTPNADMIIFYMLHST